MIESNRIRVQMILPHKPRLIAVSLQVFRQCRLALIESRKFVNPVEVRILARHDLRAAGCANQVGHQRITEPHPFIRQSI